MFESDPKYYEIHPYIIFTIVKDLLGYRFLRRANAQINIITFIDPLHRHNVTQARLNLSEKQSLLHLTDLLLARNFDPFEYACQRRRLGIWFASCEVSR